MAKTLFDHINAITQEKDPKYWDKLEESDKKTWSNYMRVIELVGRKYEVSLGEAEDYVHILYQTTSGKNHIKQIAEDYGTDPKQITKLKLKV